MGQKHNDRGTPTVRDDGRLAGAVRMLDKVLQQLDTFTGEPDFDPDRERDREEIANMRDELEAAARLVIARWSNG